jgi:N-acetyl sugar amidotransferase
LLNRLCTRCVLPSSYPGLAFDEHGVCSECRSYDRWTENWKSNLPSNKQTLQKICTQAKKKHKEFDALIPFSGGKDSTFVLYTAKKQLGLNCLALTFDNGYLSEYAKNNIDKTCKKLGVEHIFYRFNPELLNRLYALFIKKTGYFCSICMRGMAVGITVIADLYDTPLIISGTSRRTELLGTRAMSEHGSVAHTRAVLKNEPIMAECRRFLYTYAFKRKVGHVLFRLRKGKSLSSYAWLQLPDFYEWNYANIEETIRRELDWEAPKDAEHMDCLIHPIQRYIQARRFPDLDFDRLTYARLIMAGQMTRDEAIRKLEAQKTEGLESALKLFLDNIKMSKEEFDKFIDMGPRHLKYYKPTFSENMIKSIFHYST